MKLDDIWIEVEEQNEEVDIFNCNSDVIVKLLDGTRWIATFFTYKNIPTLVEKNRHSGECLSGKYFWASQMFLIDNISRTTIEGTVKHLLSSNKFAEVFEKIEL
jgi:hypothetical protein